MGGDPSTDDGDPGGIKERFGFKKNEKKDKKVLHRKSVGYFINHKTNKLEERTFQEGDFKKKKVIGKGKFGKVFLVQKKDDKKFYAMKVMKKKYVIKKKSVRHIKTERLLLAGIENPFVIRLRWAFHDVEKLYLVMDFVNGGEVFYHLRKEGKFSEKRAKLYAAEVFLALEYLHKNNIIHRDLKPENLLIGMDGHLILTDFGLSKIMNSKEDFTKTLCGTLDYIAPEMITVSKKKRKGYDQMIDWWGFGILLHEFFVGEPPFTGKNVHEVYNAILNKKVHFPKKLKISAEAKDLVKSLLHKKPKKRLGAKGPEEIRKHPFFKDLNWDDVIKKKYKPEFVPKLSGGNDTKYINPHYLKMPLSSLRKPFDPKLIREYEKQFEDFSFTDHEKKKNTFDK